MEQLANMSVWAQILGWGVFMGLNGYIGATCPGLNLAVLAFVGSFASRKVGIWLLVVAIIITLLETAWYILAMYAAGMSSLGNAKTTSFLQQGTGFLNLIVAGIVFFMLLSKFGSSFASPKWLTVAIVLLFYVAGAWAGVKYWIPVVSQFLALGGVGLLMVLSTTTSYIPLLIGSSLFLALGVIWGVELAQWGHEKANDIQEDKINSQLLEAVANNQQEQIAKLWNTADRNAKKGALENALTAKNKELVSFLIKRGVEINDTMRHAVYDNDIDTIKMLVEAGGTLEPVYVEDAANSDFLPAVQFFVDQGVDINQEYNRPLSKACEKGHIEIAEYLLKTDKNSQETLDEALVELCSSSSYYDNETAKVNLAKLLLKQGAQANSHADAFNQTPLHGASSRGPLELVKLLVSNGADVNAINEDGTTPLRDAVQEDKLEIAKFLLQQGANQTINQRYEFKNGSSSGDGETALFNASSAAMAKLLIENGAQIAVVNKAGQSVLLNAINKRNPELVKVLLDNGAEVNKQDNKGTTALLSAVRDSWYTSDTEIVKLLLDRGAGVNIADKEGNTPLSLAKKETNSEVIALLKSAGAKE
ncbi:MAG: ankyrin repeat domain-containing protein [Elusimicrobiaceae bacterium]|nr:ankyrin repeat domain-containing protein [Elusimicrobiaceae bacterium]